MMLAVLLGVAAAAVHASSEAPKLKPEGVLYVDRDGHGLSGPQGVACSGTILAVADTGHGRIVLYEVREEAVRPGGEIVASQVPLPIALALLPGGDLFALDGRSRRIARLAPTGELRGWVELEDAVEPRALALGPRDELYVLDLRGRSVLVLDAQGKVGRRISIPREAAFPSDVAVSVRGEVYVVDSVGRRVYGAGPTDTAFVALGAPLTDELDFPSALAVDDEGHLFVLDEHGSGIVILGRDGSFHGRQSEMGWREGFLRYPVDACVDGRGSLFVAERGNNRVQRFRLR
jgi:sugar lactone lactonase YvrE